MTKRTDAEVMELLRGDSALNKARQIFSGECGRIEQAGMQRLPLGPIEMRRMEFEAVEKIAAALTRPDRLCSCKASQRDGQHMAWCPALSSQESNKP